ncbi:hypothetical protein LJC61_07170 [Ruminococcaceae bacterium OttesenSCG-928-A16]|nr:hypothetical protein [Ruminococcaceae bacterium OttesenSCG-928-A16]
MEQQKKPAGKTTMQVLMVIFVAISVGLIIYLAMIQEYSFMMRGLFFPLFLLIPPLFKWVGLQPCYKLFSLLYAFIIFAYSFGCVYGVFTHMQYMDKISHFASGIVFTILGFCLHYWLVGPQPGGLRQGGFLAGSYALFFSMFIAVMWEVIEFFDFNLTGNDSQNMLTTGVFDTMQDLIACLVASLLCVAAFALYYTQKAKLLTPAIVEEFYTLNVAPKAGPSKKRIKNK